MISTCNLEMALHGKNKNTRTAVGDGQTKLKRAMLDNCHEIFRGEQWSASGEHALDGNFVSNGISMVSKSRLKITQIECYGFGFNMPCFRTHVHCNKDTSIRKLE